jgi:minor extracellular serine protease Vpr
MSTGGPTEPMYDVFIKTANAAATRAAVEAAGGRVRSQSGLPPNPTIMTASLPASAFSAVETTAIYFEAPKPLTGKNDVAVPSIGADKVQLGTGLPGPYKGAGTIIGIIDSGIDYTHPDFKDSSGKNRILAIWDQKGSSGTPPEAFDYGMECNAEQIAAQTCPVNDPTGHGTHVAAIAAGADPVYRGVAPEANIIAVRYLSEIDMGDGYVRPVFSTNISDAVAYIFKKAQALGMPAVVNLSLGTHIGAHDGMSLFEEFLNGQSAPGHLMVSSAGNELNPGSNVAGLHTGFTVSGPMAVHLEPLSFAQGRFFYIDIWESPGSDIQIGLRAIQQGTPNLIDESGMVALGGMKSGSLAGGKISFEINATEVPSAINQKAHVGVSITFSDTVATPTGFSFDLMLSGSGNGDAWCWPDRHGALIRFTSGSGPQAGTVYGSGDNRMTIAMPSTAKDVISVSAYTTRSQYTVGALTYQVPYLLGDILNYASSGPSANPSVTGSKPDIAAPGALIASAKSKDYAAPASLVLADGKHVFMEGTSMAAPFVSGTVALMLSINPSLTTDDVRRILAKTATVDSFVGTAPNDRWGAGKLNSFAAIQETIATNVSAPPPAPAQEASAQATDSGKGSCGLIPDKISTIAPPLGIAAMVLAGVLLALFRRKEALAQKAVRQKIFGPPMHMRKRR